MPVTVGVRFPLGRYHATPWDEGANTSEPEWPPSPWRLARALLSVGHTRATHLEPPDIDRLLDRLGPPSAYKTPAVGFGGTRHYLPDLNHSRGETGNTDLTLDTFVAIDPAEEILIRWETDLTEDQQTTLRELCDLLPYLGRSESVCIARVLPDSAPADSTWWRLGDTSEGSSTARLLSLDSPFVRSAAEATTTSVRKQRLAQPPGTRWLTYGRGTAVGPPPRPGTQAPRHESMLFHLHGAVHVRARAAVTAIDQLHRAIAWVLGDRAGELLGRDGEKPAGGLHRHAHILAAPSRADSRQRMRPGDAISTLALWVPGGIAEADGAMIQHRIRELRPPRGDSRMMALQRVSVGRAGNAADVLGALAGSGSRWHTVVPYLPVRHQKRRQQYDEFLLDDLRRECGYRGLGAPVRVVVDTADAARADAVSFARRRTGEPLPRARHGVHLTIEFGAPVSGPLLLGQLSHFGYGVFAPTADK